MRYLQLGSTGTSVSGFALGTMTFGAELDQEGAHAVLDAYVEAGGNLIDTADNYGNGVSEEIVGQWIRRTPGARDVVLATKARFAVGLGPNDLGTSRFHLRRALDDSLRRLGVDRIDLYQLHSWDPVTPVEETLRFLDDAIHAGKIDQYGFSNYLGWQVARAAGEARLHGWAPPATLQPQYNLLARQIEHEVVPAALDAGLGLLPWSPLAGGWLSGKYERDVLPTGASRLGENPKRGLKNWDVRNGEERTWRVVDAVRRVAAELGATPAQVALAWLAGRPGVASVIIGVRTTAQLHDNVAASDLDLPHELRAELDAVSAPDLDDYPYYAAGRRQRSRDLAGGRLAVVPARSTAGAAR